MTKPPPGRVTIVEVAKHAQVSPSTVSLVLNGRHDRMGVATRERVMRAVEELGYSANQMARGLKTGFVPMIGMVVPTVANPFWGEFARCVEHAAIARNYQVLLCNAERVPERERLYVESMLARGIRGVILGSSPLSLNHLSGVTKRGLKVVVFDRPTGGSEGIESDSVQVDNALGAQLAVNHLLELGHRRIGFVSGSVISANRRDRLDGYRGALQTAGIEPFENLISVENLNPSNDEEEATEIGRTAAIKLLRQPAPPTALFAINDMTAIGIYAGVRELGLRIPEDISVVGFDDIHLCKIMDPPITTVRQPLDLLMNSAVELLIGRMEGKNSDPPAHVKLTPELIVRGSSAACNATL